MDRGRTPSIKGFILQGLWMDLKALLGDGAVSRETAELRLGAEALEVLDGKVEPSLWYANETFVQFSELVAEAVGEADERFWVERGRRAGARLLGDGSVLSRFVAGLKDRGTAAGRALMKFPDLMMNYGRWEFESSRDDRFTVHFRDAAPLPDSLRFAIQGAGEVVATRLRGAPVRVSSRRPRADYVVFEGRFDP